IVVHVDAVDPPGRDEPPRAADVRSGEVEVEVDLELRLEAERPAPVRRGLALEERPQGAFRIVGPGAGFKTRREVARPRAPEEVLATGGHLLARDREETRGRDRDPRIPRPALEAVVEPAQNA